MLGVVTHEVHPSASASAGTRRASHAREGAIPRGMHVFGLAPRTAKVVTGRLKIGPQR
jgi:hypothetical protein